MLKPLKEPKRDRRIRYLTYDFEWNRIGNPKKLRIAGTFDGERYRVYRTMAEFMENEFIPDNHGKRFYAHNSGASDVEFILQEILTSPLCRSYSVSGVFSGASAIILEITKGRHTWTLVDSLWTIRESLKNIGRWLKMKKGEVDFDTDNIHELTDYNEQDCQILYAAIGQFEDAVLSLGSELGKTAASTALRLFLRAYLGRDLETGEIVRPNGVETSPRFNDRIRRAYMGGRTEPWNTRRGLSGYVYDVRSAYPAAMQHPVPGALVGHSVRFPSPSRNLEYIADVTINVPEHLAVPPLPRQAEGSLFFDVGVRRGWYCRPELELAEEWGCEILKIHECLCFEPLYDLAQCSMDLFNRRAIEKKKNGEGFLEQTYKLLGNSLYGKFSERAEKSTLLINPSPEEIRRAKTFSPYTKNELSPICPGVWIVTHDAQIRHAHVPIAAYITSRARANLARHLAKTDPYYCDTDSIACGDPDIPVGTELGELQLEKSFQWAYFRGAKFYMMQVSGEDEKTLRKKEERYTGRPYAMPQGDGQGGIYTDPAQLCWDFARTAVRAKGFSKIGPGQFRELDMGGIVPIDAMLMKIREMYKAGVVAPQETTRHKRLLDRVRPKRKPLPDGRTEAWHVRDFDVPYQVSRIDREHEREAEDFALDEVG